MKIDFDLDPQIIQKVEELLREYKDFLHGPWLSPIVVVSKKNKKLIFFVDFQKLNATSKKGPYPSPFT
jgi:hypothetical protein